MSSLSIDLPQSKEIYRYIFTKRGYLQNPVLVICVKSPCAR